MEDVYVQLVVPLGHPDSENHPMEFYCWLPLDEADRIRFDDADRSLTLSIVSDRSDSAASVPANAPVWSVIADVTVRNLPDEVIAGIKIPPDYSHIHDLEFLENNPHIRLAKETVQYVIDRVNRLLSYVRNHRGQYMLTEIPPMHHSVTSSLLKLKAKIRVGESEWKSWRPPGGVLQWTAKGYRGDRERIINKEDWPEIQRAVTSNERPNLVRELLAGAEALAYEGHRRAAITEAVTALEVAIHRFATNPNKDVLATARCHVTGGESLKKQVEHMGLTGSVRYLLPVIVTESKVPTELLQSCSAALDLRNNVVHNGQRDVDEERLTSAIVSIRQLSLTLENFITK